MVNVKVGFCCVLVPCPPKFQLHAFAPAVELSLNTKACPTQPVKGAVIPVWKFETAIASVNDAEQPLEVLVTVRPIL